MASYSSGDTGSAFVALAGPGDSTSSGSVALAGLDDDTGSESVALDSSLAVECTSVVLLWELGCSAAYFRIHSVTDAAAFVFLGLLGY